MNRFAEDLETKTTQKGHSKLDRFGVALRLKTKINALIFSVY